MASSFTNTTRTDCLPFAFDPDETSAWLVCAPGALILFLSLVAVPAPRKAWPAIALSLVTTWSQGLLIWESITDTSGVPAFALWAGGPIVAGLTLTCKEKEPIVVYIRRAACFTHCVGWITLVNPYLAGIYGTTTPQAVARFYMPLSESVIGAQTANRQSLIHAGAGTLRTASAALSAQVALTRARVAVSRERLYGGAAVALLVAATVTAAASSGCAPNGQDACYAHDAWAILCGDGAQELDCQAQAEPLLFAATLVATVVFGYHAMQWINDSSAAVAIALRAVLVISSALPHLLITPVTSGREATDVVITDAHDAPCDPWLAPVSYMFIGAAEVATSALWVFWIAPTMTPPRGAGLWHDRSEHP